MRADVPPAQAILAGHWSPRNAGPEATPLRRGDHSPRQSQHEKPLVARAQQGTMITVGFLSNSWPTLSENARAFREGLREMGFAFGYGRSDWSTKLTRGLSTEKKTGFQSRWGWSDESALITHQHAPFPTYKTEG